MSFDRLAPHYDWMEAVTAGSRLQRARIEWIEALEGRRRILSVGEGHGRFAAACLARFPEAELTCVDSSPGMIARAQLRLGKSAGRVNWILGNAADWRPPGRYDAIVTCFFLDCFPPDTLAAVVARLAAAVADDAVWLVADFAIPSHRLARLRAQAVHKLMYTFFRAAVRLPARRMTSPDSQLARQGFELKGRRDYEWGLIRSDLWRRAGPGSSEDVAR